MIEGRFKIPGKKSSDEILEENKNNCSSEYQMLLKSFIDLCYVDKTKAYVDEQIEKAIKSIFGLEIEKFDANQIILKSIVWKM